MAQDSKKPAAKDASVASALGHCLGQGCKSSPSRFGFCEEHYEQFKFGLIRKTGEPVPDFEKKVEHYKAYRARKPNRVA